MSTEKWDIRFLELTKQIATWSKDPRTKVGSIIVSDRRRIVSVGYNGFPRGVDDTEDRLLNREQKILFVAHAERNALDNAECSVADSTLYTTLFPCNECAKSIIQRSIKKIVSYKFDDELVEKFNFDISLKMFYESGVECIFYDK
jgi:dCMP deaminase